MKAFRLLTVLVAMTVTDARGAGPEVKRQAADAIKTAACVRDAVLMGVEALGKIPQDELSDAQREEVGRRLKVSDEIQVQGVQKCVTEEDAYNIGWYQPLDDAVSKCGLRRTKALDRYREDADLINGTALAWWRSKKTFKTATAVPIDMPDAPSFHGEYESEQYFRDKPLQEKCDALLAGYGPKGDRFPGLVEPIKSGS